MRMPLERPHTITPDDHEEHAGETSWWSGSVRPTARRQQSETSVVNLITGFIATDEVSLKGSRRVAHHGRGMQIGSLSFNSTSDQFLALSKAPPAFGHEDAWYSPNSAMEIRYR